MKKVEWVYREIVYQALEKKNNQLTQLALAEKLQISLSTVNHALEPLRNMGAIAVHQRYFTMNDPKKILYHWASIRNLRKDIIYATRVDKPITKIESEMPSTIIFGAYSAYKYHFRDVPADYSEMYIYGDTEEIKKRFPPNQNTPNLFVLQKDNLMECYGQTTTLAQTFVDLWNLKEWYAKEFLLAMEKRIQV
ncbi:winged helix-turn-helix domain-containing protein [Candidatus Woesearchaeota archaeon]|nr:winged helix-turn-helix domain-containing protein [Candidatus Woesearchaeota archaeon]